MIQGEYTLEPLEHVAKLLLGKTVISLPLRICENEWFSRKIPKSSLTLGIIVFEDEKLYRSLFSM